MGKRKCKTITLPNGQRKYIYGNTKEELERKYARAKLELSAGVDISDKTTFGAFAQTWYDTFKRGKVKPQTERIIKSNLNNNVMPLLAAMEIRKISAIHCARVLKEMEIKGISYQTQRAVLCLMKNIFDCAVDNNIIMRSPVTKSVRPHGNANGKREAISTEEANELTEKMKAHDFNEYAVTVIALQTAMRIGEIFALKWTDIDLTEKIIHVRATMIRDGASGYKRQEQPKTKSGFRDIPYGETVAKVIATLKLQSASEFVFSSASCSPVDYNFYNRLKYHYQKINPAVTPHVLRHTAITKWICNDGMDVKTAQYLAGHSDVNITYNIYTSFVKNEKFSETIELIRSLG